jgi:NAD-dependent dihydropyrimidine dehydrogenase PreA subunit
VYRLVRTGAGVFGGRKMDTIRKVVKIDEEKCDGCGLCAEACAEGAIQMIDEKARLVNESHCDGLGACLGECPQGAITLEEKRAEPYDDKAAHHHKSHKKHMETTKCCCPSMQITRFDRESANAIEKCEHSQSMLGHWPVQLALVPPDAPFLRDAELLLVADCVPFAYADFHRDFLSGRSVFVACPKLDDAQAHLNKLALILRRSTIKSITVARMEVPCCSGLTTIARQALELSQKDIPLKEIVIGIRGDIKRG